MGNDITLRRPPQKASFSDEINAINVKANLNESLFRVNILDRLAAVVVVEVFPDPGHQVLVNVDVFALPSKAVTVLTLLVHVVHLAGRVVAYPALKLKNKTQ